MFAIQAKPSDEFSIDYQEKTRFENKVWFIEQETQFLQPMNILYVFLEPNRRVRIALLSASF